MATCRTTYDGAHEGWGPVSRLREFDLTPCFEEGILLSTLLVLLLVVSLFRLWATKPEIAEPTRTLTTRSASVLKAKLVFLGAAFSVSLANIAFVAFGHIRVPVFQSYILEPLALLPAIFLTHANHKRTRTSSSTLLLFWPTYTVALLIWGRTLATIYSGNISDIIVPLALHFGVLLFGLFSFALELIAPKFELDIDDEVDETHVENPVISANIFSRWSFGYMTPTLKKGAKDYITDKDLPSLLKEDQAAELGQKLTDALAKRKSLYLGLAVAYGKPFAFALFLKLVQDCLSFLQPQFLRWLLSFITDYQDAREGLLGERPTPLIGFSYALLMFLASVLQTIILHQYFQRVFETGLRVRAGLVTVIYQKSLRISNDGQGRSTGEVVSLMSVDSTRLQEFCTYGLIIISGTFQIILAFVSLYNLLGWSAFVGVAIMVFSIPLNAFTANILKKLQLKQMKSRDKRTKMMSELLNNIKSIKLYAWDYAFMNRVMRVRNDEELKNLRKIGIVGSLNSSLWSGIPFLVAFSSFATAAYISPTPLTADIIFPAISLFMLLQFPLAMFAMVISNLIEAIVSVKRISSFLDSEELQTDARDVILKENIQDGDEVLSIANAEFYWSKDGKEPTLQDINLTVRKGELIAVLGQVGAGKSSLLSAIIGAMRRTEGKIGVYGTVAYVPQNPWIMSGTIKDNILFSHHYDETFYNLVLDACALRPDLALLSHGDMTEVGEKGITLSGGQRARVALARAIYARADLVLLDDVLAAVDAHVARHIYDHVVGPDGLLATKARILVTNSISFLTGCSNIVLIRRGIILESGSFETIMSNNHGEIQKLIREHTRAPSSGASTPFPRTGEVTPQEDNSTLVPSPTNDSPPSLSTIEEKLKRRNSYGRSQIKLPTRSRLPISEGIQQEHSEKGRVKSSVYRRYIEACSTSGFALFIAAIVVAQAFSILSNFALRSWSEDNRQTRENRGITKYLALSGIAQLLSVFFFAIATVALLLLCALRSSKQLHDNMLNSLIHAPLSFFEQTPTGRVLNIFSKDIYNIDSVLPRTIQSMFRTMATCIGIIIVIGIFFPIFLVVVPPLAWFYVRVMTYYLDTSRELKRLDAVSRSPIFAWFSESIAGLSTIRAFGQEEIFLTNHKKKVDANQICYMPSVLINRWLAVRLEFVGTCIIFVVSNLALVALITTGVDAALVGLVLSYALNTTSALNWVVRSASDVEQNIVSVERILHYVELKPEAPYEIPDTEPKSWPTAGEVKFVDYATKYRPELDLVLKDINVTVNAKEKIGICGRTGSGKSSFLLALFRILEATQGGIEIDGVDISKIGLRNLRSAISIVPQSPDLFEGTLRENIDPVGTYQDADIWRALEQVRLKEFVEGLEGGLEATVKEGGSSLSAGQRQLLCFARALLRKTKILVLDEATSAVDLDTDKAIQEIIRGPEFADVTLLTIAHRLNTIIDYDRILVLGSGRVVEFDSPKVLLDKKDSQFYSLALEAGLA
ncbi:metal resistance protein YCF1 [Thelephora terrestris]|uniref:Metal resistance protein YCF1 n=1 Tax=Thelephora terrestris TaxID=56493 RepID=A0A9P6H495_9AGAM|nr:metal resistance protein YCF1 [Thelephora terrestris]